MRRADIESFVRDLEDHGRARATVTRRARGGEIYDSVIIDAPTADGNGWTVRELQGQVQARAMCTPAS